MRKKQLINSTGRTGRIAATALPRDTGIALLVVSALNALEAPQKSSPAKKAYHSSPTRATRQKEPA